MKNHLPYKKILILLGLTILPFSTFAHDLFFETANGTATTFGNFDSYVKSSSTLKKNTATNYNNAHIESVFNYVLDNTKIVSELNKLKSHISGTTTLTAAQLNDVNTAIVAEGSLFENDEAVIKLGFEIVGLYETKNGALFTKGTTTLDGFNKTASGYELENAVLSLMQLIVDYSYTNTNLAAYPTLFNNVLFKTSSFFPGAVTPPTNSNVSYTRKINGTHIKVSGTQPNYVTEDARRPTGCYLAPGSLGTVTVPSSLVGIGASILVGANTWDLSQKTSYKRMDRVTIAYPITSTTTTIGNPLGGGIYINIPYQKNLGIINITLKNVVRSPYYAKTVANQTSSSDWLNTERLRNVPWTDIETEKVMFQVPTSWIYAHNGLEKAIEDWDLSMDAISELLGRPLVRSKTVVYAQVDVIARGSANFPGYPQSNITYNPYTNYGGYKSDLLTDGPRDKRGYTANVFFHELGHGEKIYKFVGEIESFINFLWVSVHNKKFGVDLNTAFEESFNGYGLNHSIEEAAISWMIAENFRLGNPMSTTTGENRQELSYQPRGHAKYADLVRLFGWEALENHYETVSTDYDNGTINYDGNVNNVPIDVWMLRMSKAAGYDLRPLMHFWGMHPVNASDLEASIKASNLKKSTKIYDQLVYYKSIVPINNSAFQAFGLKDYTATEISKGTYYDNVSMSYNQGFLKKWWNTYDTAEAQAAVDQVQAIINLYFPYGRPNEGGVNYFIPDPNKTYYIDSPIHNLRLAATGESENAYSTSTTSTGADVEWKFIKHSSGAWHIQRAAGGTKPRLRSVNTENADMQETTFTGGWTYFEFPEGQTTDTYYIVLPEGPEAHKRLQINSDGSINMVSNLYNGDLATFKITEASSPVLAVEDSLDPLTSPGFEVYPTPIINTVTIKGEKNSTLYIFDINGKKILTKVILNESETLDLSNLESGFYFAKMHHGTKVYTKKLIKK